MLLCPAARLAACFIFVVVGAACSRPQPARTLPRTADGKPNLQGVWQVRNSAAFGLEDHVARDGMPAGRSVVEGRTIPYLPDAATQRLELAANVKANDPLAKCYMPGVPRIMYLPFPFHIYQTPDHIAITFEWSQVHRTIHTNGVPGPEGIDFWMGDSRGRWEGDTLVVDVKDLNGKTWLDTTGTFHTDQVHVVERYTLTDPDTIQYEATIEDPKVFSRPWTISMPIYRHTDRDRILEYQCQAELEEANGDFERDPKTWYPGPSAKPVEIPADWAAMSAPASFDLPEASAPTPERPGQTVPGEPAKPSGPPPIRRMADGKPDLSGFYMPDAGGGNYGLGKHEQDFLTPAGRGIIVDPPDGTLPMQPWAQAEVKSRVLPERGYDDPTAHCFVAGVPRSMYVPSPLHILQPPGYVVILHERMSWRSIPLDGRPFLPDEMRLWQGDSVGKWDGDTLVVETRNLNGKTWLNEVGEIVSHAQRVIERFKPITGDLIHYQATVSDPLVYTRPWTIAIPLNRQKDELLEVACHEDNQDLQHLKDVRDEARAKARTNSTR